MTILCNDWECVFNREGIWIYDTEEEAIKAWNCRLGGDDHVKT